MTHSVSNGISGNTDVKVAVAGYADDVYLFFGLNSHVTRRSQLRAFHNILQDTKPKKQSRYYCNLT